MKRLTINLLLLLLTPAVSPGQQPNSSDWKAVEGLKAGTKIVVITRSGREFVGRKRIANDELLFMEEWPTPQLKRTISIERAEIREVRKNTLHWIYKVAQYKVTASDEERDKAADTCGPRQTKSIYVKQK
jgi:hypothetical protein